MDYWFQNICDYDLVRLQLIFIMDNLTQVYILNKSYLNSALTDLLLLFVDYILRSDLGNGYISTTYVRVTLGDSIYYVLFMHVGELNRNNTIITKVCCT